MFDSWCSLLILILIQVRFVVDESFELRNEATGEPAAQTNGVRSQKSVWTFEGNLGSADLAWRVVAIY
jgi:hypothetical protein